MIGVAAAAGMSVGGLRAELPVAENVFPGLAPILRDALALSPRMVQQNLDRLRAEQDAHAAAGQLRPRVDASVQQNFQRELRADLDHYISTRKLYYSLGASYPLFSWGALQDSVEISRISAQITDRNFREAYRGLADEIRRAYLQLIISKAGASHAQYAEDLTRRRLEVLQEQVKRGEAAAGAPYGVELDLNERSLETDSAEFNLERALNAFRRLTGRSDFTAEQVPGEIPAITPAPPDEVSPLNLAYVEQDGFKDDSRYERSELELRSAKRSLHIARVAQRPRLSLLAGVTEDELAYVSNIGQRSGVRSIYAAVSVSWNIFDGFANRGRVRSARTRVRMLEEALSTLEDTLTDAARDAATALDLARRGMVNADNRYSSSQGGYRHLQTEIEAGRATREQLDNAQVGVNAAQLRAFSARATYLNALSAYVSAVNADPVAAAAAEAPLPQP